MDKAKLAIAAYVLVGIVTFGHASASTHAWAKQTGKLGPEEGAVYVGMLAAMVWPLYWSYKLFEVKP